MQTEPNAKQQIVERLRSSTNILVTVGRNPSVDALSAALGLTLMLNRLDKHATAVFSGDLPSTLNFLEPNKTFENSVDSLRDFIISLDKEKADRLRYKVENDVVRIFITPYRTVISEKDLKFSQGDFNVELIVALGVEKRQDLDAAITAHGRILHDATVMTINAGASKSTLGSIDWSEASASSLSEMLMSLSEALQPGLIDEQIATAVLTGIVAATDRFRNEHTSPRVMTMAAQLMAAGANQQLIAAKLEEGQTLPEPDLEDGSRELSEDRSEKVQKTSKKPSNKKDATALEVNHEDVADTPVEAPAEEAVEPAPVAAEEPPVAEPAPEAPKDAEAELAASLEQAAPVAPTLSVDDLKGDLAAAAKEVEEAANSTQPDPSAPKIIKQERRSWQSDLTDKPAFGGTLNATVSDAEEAKRQEEEAKRSQKTLSHAAPVSYDPAQSVPVAETPVAAPPVPSFEPAEPQATAEPQDAPEPAPASRPLESTSDEALSFEPAPIETASAPTLAQLDDQTRGKAAEDARAAVDAALSAMPFDPASRPVASAGATPVFEVAHETTPSTPVEAAVQETISEQAPAELSVVPPVAPQLPPLPDFSKLPPLPEETPGQTVPAEPPTFTSPQVPNLPEAPQPQPTAPAPAVPAASAPADPGQFRIPGQL